MARRPRTPGIESSAELARKAEILERELQAQRTALEKLKQLGERRRDAGEDEQDRPQRRSA